MKSDFRKYAIHNHGIAGTVVDDVISHIYGPEMMTRTVIEERNMPFSKIIQLEWINKWDGALPNYMMGNGQGVILNLPNN